jgi:hypothetical protein
VGAKPKYSGPFLSTISEEDPPHYRVLILYADYRNYAEQGVYSWCAMLKLTQKLAHRAGVNPSVETILIGTLTIERSCEWQRNGQGDIQKPSDRWRSSGNRIIEGRRIGRAPGKAQFFIAWQLNGLHAFSNCRNTL